MNLYFKYLKHGENTDVLLSVHKNVSVKKQYSKHFELD